MFEKNGFNLVAKYTNCMGTRVIAQATLISAWRDYKGHAYAEIGLPFGLRSEILRSSDLRLQFMDLISNDLSVAHRTPELLPDNIYLYVKEQQTFDIADKPISFDVYYVERHDIYTVRLYHENATASDIESLGLGAFMDAKDLLSQVTKEREVA
jgi:hypothetical protein